ncbi:MAG: transketolase C-terminal domain-containing protein, partial [Hydrogenoanaerobacterium sp.]
FLSTIPNVTVYSPTTYAELRHFLYTALYVCTGPVALRYPRGKEPSLPQEASSDDNFKLFSNCKAKTLAISYGREFAELWHASELLSDQKNAVALLKLNCICPIDEACIEAAAKYDNIFFVEEGILQGGVAEHFLARLKKQGWRGSYRIRAIDGVFVPQATVKSALKKFGLSAEDLAK